MPLLKQFKPLLHLSEEGGVRVSVLLEVGKQGLLRRLVFSFKLVREGQVQVCGGAKGGTWAAVTCEAGTCTWLSREAQQNHPHPSRRVWKQGRRIFESADGLDTKDIAMATGAVLSRVYWEKDGSVREVH